VRRLYNISKKITLEDVVRTARENGFDDDYLTDINNQIVLKEILLKTSKL
jgi:hypothetical protein